MPRVYAREVERQEQLHRRAVSRLVTVGAEVVEPRVVDRVPGKELAGRPVEEADEASDSAAIATGLKLSHGVKEKAHERNGRLVQ